MGHSLIFRSGGGPLFQPRTPPPCMQDSNEWPVLLQLCNNKTAVIAHILLRPACSNEHALILLTFLSTRTVLHARFTTHVTIVQKGSIKKQLDDPMKCFGCVKTTETNWNVFWMKQTESRWLICLRCRHFHSQIKKIKSLNQLESTRGLRNQFVWLTLKQCHEHHAICHDQIDSQTLWTLHLPAHGVHSFASQLDDNFKSLSICFELTESSISVDEQNGANGWKQEAINPETGQLIWSNFHV